MKKFFLGIVLTCVIAIASMASAQPINETRVAFDDVHQDMKFDVNSRFSYPTILVFGTAIGAYRTKSGAWGFREVYFAQMGSGWVAKYGYVFTNSHVVNCDSVTTPEGKWGGYSTEVFKVTSITIILRVDSTIMIPARIVRDDPGVDCALLSYEYPEAMEDRALQPIPYEISDRFMDLAQGDAVAAIVHVRENGNVTPQLKRSPGFVLDEGPRHPARSVVASLTQYDFTMSAVLLPGDSGSPIIAWINGKGYVVGLGRAGAPVLGFTCYFYACRMGWWARYLQ